ncbi:DNA topoisomerase 2-binding protein 1-like isoform X1 [Lytechinus variegatus]|uniref:DNA topoisomerase 2-binding protein 1-like isoform X1 n=2 Tax=Lytechinus variegatus TaxID=7654 RepID=UPI001BB1DED8|nr:DNA topoisomerase 2-binding protein 1-like isoform X1 [Lytechinus variegatus]
MSTKVKFVVDGSGEQDLMLKAAQSVQSARLPTEKITSKDVLQLKSKDKNLYVCGQFLGEAFDHLVNIKCRIVGPQCVISCLELQKAVPNVPHPINNIAMQDVVVSCSSIERAQRARIHQLLEWMGGKVSKDLTEIVTHLVVGEVGSKKYHVAANLKKHIMLPEWIEVAWEESQTKHFSAKSEEFHSRYRCPAFKGCIICVTGVEASQRQDVRQRVPECGGYYTGELKYNECTHLIVGAARGPKFEFARKWKIHTVSINWFYDSVEAGYCLDEQLYNVLSQEQPTSTPVKANQEQPRLSALGNISAINVSSIHPIDETAVSDANITMETSRLVPPLQPQVGLAELEKLDLATCEAEMFLDGCKIFLSGFSGQHLEKLRKVVNAGGGTRFNQINENVSHVIIGNRIENHVTELKELPNRPSIVSVHWLLECAKQGRQVSEQDFIVKDILDVHEADDKENEITFKLPANQVKRVSKVGSRKRSDEHGEEEDILSQYLPNATSAGNGDNDSTMIQEENADRTRSDGDRTQEDDDETQIDENEEGDDGEKNGIFAGKKFVVLGFLPEQEHNLCEMIPSQAGIVLPFNTRSIPDYAVVPIIGTLVNMTVGEIVTNCWLQMSLEAETLLEPSSNDLFTPIPIMKEAMPLRNCVISISQYSFVERDCLLHIAELLGAQCQEYFVRKAINNLEANTHLLLRDPEGTKYVASKKWKVPAITRRWLLDCARTGKKQPEKNYLVDLPKEEPSDMSTKEEPLPPKKPSSPPEEMLKAKETTPEQTKTIPKSENQQEKPLEDHPQKTPKSVTIKERSVQDTGASTSKLMSKATTPAGRPVRNKTLEMVKQPIANKSIEQVRGQTPGKESTPSRILRPGFTPSFDLDDAVEALDSPGMPVGKGHRRKSSLPLEEFFHQNITNALQMGSTKAGRSEDEDDDTVFKEEEPAPGILHGVVICVSKKLSRKQGDYNDIAMALGAEYHWTYDEKCTHFIFQGKANDTAKEFRLAKSQGKIIVSSHWLLACQEENKRLDESCYPHTYNPKLSLSVVASQGRTPARSMRSKVTPVAVATPLAPKPPPPKPPPAVEKKEDIEADTMSDDELLRAVENEEQSKTAGDHGTSINLQKQLEDIMPSTMNLRGSRRRSRRPGSSASISLAGDTTSADDSSNGRRSTRSRVKKKEEGTSKDSGQHVEASQSVQITWDDPTSRKEKAKIMAQIKRADNGLDEPEEQDGEDAQQMEEQMVEDHAETKTDVARHGASSSHKHEDSPPSPTPKAPPIRLPPARPAVAPQPMDDTQDDPQQEVLTKQPALPPKFLFTGMGAHEKIDYSALIEELGGEVKDAQYFDASCSHIIVGNPTRNEKYLAALATGKWVLHKSYFEACRAEKAFVEEEPHEWGNRTDLSKLSETGKKMARAATRWRCRIQEQEKMGSSIGAFDGWKVVLMVEKSKEMCFKRLLEAGGAKVLAVRPPFTNHLDASHAFFDLHKVKVTAEAVALDELVQSGIMCLKPEYIADYLVLDPSPDPENYIINEAKPILQKLVEQAGPATKRRGSELATTPRSKRTRHR